MADWNSTQYVKFINERTQPAIDLVNRIDMENTKKIIDIGCGPGNSTYVLASKFQDAYVLGIDNSQSMITKAKEDHPSIDFQLYDADGDLSALGDDFDLVFSNACIQWLPSHEQLLKKMIGLLRKDGVLAIQTPMNFDEPIHKIIKGTANSREWKGYFPSLREPFNLKQEEYFDILTNISSGFSMWETTYMHQLKSHYDIIEWYRSTGMKPYLDVLSDKDTVLFEREIFEKVEKAYEIQKNGDIIFRFPRFFFIALS